MDQTQVQDLLKLSKNLLGNTSNYVKPEIEQSEDFLNLSVANEMCYPCKDCCSCDNWRDDD